jgi:hypothetical protein
MHRRFRRVALRRKGPPAGLKLNGLDVRLNIPEATRICNTFTGAGFISASGSGNAANPHFFWTGTAWALTSPTEAPMNNLNCNT